MYESFFGLARPPFALIHDPSFLFAGRGHRDAFAALQAGLASGAKVMILTGEVGAGKTTLVQALLASVDPASTSTLQVSAAHLDAESLSERLSEALELPRQPEPLARRDALLTSFVSSPRATLLVIDEAQHLTPSAFELLGTLAESTALPPARLQICLVGQPELRILLNAGQRSGFRELIGVDRHLSPLEQSEIRLYVEHRLHRAGWTGRPEFEDAAFAEIFIFTAGNPRRINLLCNSLMLCAFLKKQQRIDAPAVTWAAAAMREDSIQGAPDLLDLGSHFEHRPTLTDAFEEDTQQIETTTGRGHAPAWSCPGCGGVNPAIATRCSTCEAARPGVDAFAESPGDRNRASENAGTASPDAATVEPTSAPAADDAFPPSHDETVREFEADRSERMRQQGMRASPRRRQAILAGASALGVALALLAYVIGQEVLRPGLSQNEMRNIAGNRPTSPALPRPAVDPQRGAAGSVASASSAQASAAAPTSPSPMPDEVSGPADAAPDRGLPVAPVPSATPEPACSGPAFALGLCDVDSSSTRRQ